MKIKTKRYNIKDKFISKELSGLRMALFSDTHNQTFGEDDRILLDIFDREKPDIVVFAGDAINKIRYDVDKTTGAENALGLFTKLGKKYEVYYIDGNHDARLKTLCEGHEPFDDCALGFRVDDARGKLSLDPAPTYDDYISAIKDAGVHVLSNESIELADKGLCITGLELPLKYYRHKCAPLTIDELRDFIGEPRRGFYNLLIAHTPEFFPVYASWGANLTLSGHVHGGIFRLPIVGGLLSPYRTFFPKYDYGLFKSEDAKMIVSSGAGSESFRGKITNPLEVVMITLERAE